MNKEIKQILKDLYKLDKNLKQHEKELVEVIQKLITSKPKNGFTSEFKEKLKLELMSKISEIKKSSPKTNVSLNFMNKFSYGLAGGLVVIVLAIPVIYLNNQINVINTTEVVESLGFNNAPILEDLGGNAFGQIVTSQEKIAGDSSTARLQSGGGGGGLTITSPLFAPVFYNYQFSYTGEDFTLDQSEMDVFKKYTDANLQTKLAQMIKTLNLGFINLSSLSNVKVQNFNIVEDKQGGYSVAIGLNDESASINIYYNQPYQIEEQKSLTENDILSDDKIIEISNNLFKKFGLNLSNYGQITVDHSWKTYYNQNSEEDISRYIPDIISVTYQTIINNMAVYDESGNPNGPQANVNMRYARADGAWGIGGHNFQKSKYSIEQDKEKILKLALRGGYRRYYDQQSNGEVVNIELGTPKVSLVAVNNFKNGTYEQLFVPALIFPVTNDVDQTKFYQKNIVVPLVKDLLNEDINQPQPTPLPVDIMIK